MYIDAFKVFCDLVETNSFSQAAVVNDLTQSAVSQQIRNLELRLGVTLLERAGRSISLTPEGQAFHRACKSILNTWDTLQHDLRDLKNEVAGRLRIASIFSIGMHELPPLLKRFREQFPEVQVEVEYRRAPQVYDMVDEGTVDLGLVAFPARRQNLVHEIFREDRLVIICHPSHRLASESTAPLSALNGERFIGFEPDTPTRKSIDRHLREAGVSVTHHAEFDNVETVKRAVEIESGVSIVPASTVEAEVANGQLAAVEIASHKLTRPLGFLLQKARARPAGLKQLMEILKS